MRRKSPKTAKRWKTAAELEQLLAERAREPASRIAVYGTAETWNAALIVGPTGNAERRMRFKGVVDDLRREVALKD